jgi:hypothetical protein
VRVKIDQLPSTAEAENVAPAGTLPPAKSHSLDPQDWEQLREQAHRMLDDILNYTRDIRQRPVWQPIPQNIRAQFQDKLPAHPSSLKSVHEEFKNRILPYGGGNVHFPLLLRALGFHTGRHFICVDKSDDLPAALARIPGPEIIAMEYLDARGRDGKSRKYRVMLIGGKLYPLHLAISSHWKIHYFTARWQTTPRIETRMKSFSITCRARLARGR